MRSNLPRVFVALVLTAASLASAGALIPRINDERSVLQINVPPELVEEMPPEIAVLSVMLGSFRGLLVDYLWERATSLQQEGKFYESVQIAGWITKLQPKYPRVWGHVAWNMANNISLATHTPEERWSWIQAAIILLRDEGIPANPLTLELHRDLAWKYLHNVDGRHDNFHRYFKARHAAEWEAILGSPPEATGDRIDWFRPIAEAPLEETELFQRTPGLEARLAEIRDDYPELDADLLHAVRAAWADKEHPVGPWLRSLDVAQRDALRAYLRAWVLRHHYRMQPSLMLDLMEHIGPFDWRHSASHGIYWVAQGVLRDITRKRDARISRNRQITPGVFQDDVETICTNPNMTGALRSLLERGLIQFDPERSEYGFFPDTRFLEVYALSYSVKFEQILAVPEEFKQNLKGNLENGAWMSYFRGEPDKAKRFLGELRRLFEDDPETGSFYAGTVKQFIDAIVELHLTDLERVKNQIGAMLYYAFSEGLAEGRQDVHDRFIEYDRVIHEKARQQHGEDAIDDFELMRLDALRAYFETPPREASVHGKARTWKLLPMKDKRALWPAVKDTLHRQARFMRLDPDELFPAPDPEPEPDEKP